MKRFRFGEERESEQNIMANVLMLLARGRDRGEEVNHRVFECKTCSRQFSSFQALGGHRASHKKPRLLNGGHGEAQLGSVAKPKVHECSICGIEFAIGQALGGHMRRHRAENSNRGLTEDEKERKLVPWLDLNFPPLHESMEQYQKSQGLQFKLLDNTTSMVASGYNLVPHV